MASASRAEGRASPASGATGAKLDVHHGAGVARIRAILVLLTGRITGSGGNEVKRGWLVAILVGFLLAGSAWAQQKKKEKESKGQTQEAASAGSQLLSPEEQINKEISEMLAAWQIGDVEMLHKYYADDVTVVSGLYQPLLAGWQSFAAAIEQQRKRVQ